MRKTTLLILLLLLTIGIFSQKKEPTKRIKAWHMSPMLMIADTIPFDTLHINYQAENLVEQHSIANLYNGNYGSPIQSKIYSQITNNQNFLFANGYKPYILDIDNAKFYDTTFPYTNLTYLTGGKQGRKEEQIKFMFTASSSQKMNIGFDLDYIHSIGQYNNQAVKRFGGDIFGRYSGKHYSAYALLATNKHSNHENGGLSDLSLLTNKNAEVKSQDMPFFIRGYSSYIKNLLFLNQAYTIGFNKKIKINEDSTRIDYIPVTKFSHTLKLEEMKKRYFEPVLDRNFYKATYDTIHKACNDTAALRSVTNTLSVSLSEEFNKWMRFGMTGYIENEIQQFIYKEDTLINKTIKSNTRIGGALTKTKGSLLKYRFLGDIYLIGYKLGEFRLIGNAKGNFKIAKEPISITVNAYIKNQEPSFFLQNYHSTHFRWNNDFDKVYKTHIGGTFELPKRNTRLRLNIENITKPIFFNEEGLPQQDDENVQVVELDVQQNLYLGAFTLENNVIYQVSSRQSVVPLPMLSLHHNFYYHQKWFKDLFVQLGTSVRYHTQYYAPIYVPATGQFANQRKTKIGDYPFIDIYANFHLKKARFFVKYTNLGTLFLDNYGMLMPNYPVNPSMLKFGISWNFYD